MTHRLLLLCLMIQFSSCSILIPDTRSESTKAGHQLIGNVSRRLYERYGVTTCAIRESGDKETYRLIGIGVQLHQVLTKDEARKLFVECTEYLLKEVNKDPNFVHYRSVCPFGIKNVDMSLFLSTPDRGSIYYPDVRVVSLMVGDVYFKYSKDGQLSTFLTEVETYDEAFEKVYGVKRTTH